MSEQHQQDGYLKYDKDFLCWWFYPNNASGERFVVRHDPRDGVRLNANGSTTPMCEVVTREAVAANGLYCLLTHFAGGGRVGSDDLGPDPTPETYSQLYQLGLVDGAWKLTGAGRTVLSALQQSAGHAVARWLAERYWLLLNGEHEACQYPDECPFCLNGQCDGGMAHGTCIEAMVAAAYAAAGTQPSEPVREPVRWFAEQMEAKLRKHDAKRGAVGWRDMSLADLACRLVDEHRELVQACVRGEGIIAEAADVGNIAMMMADNARALLAQRQPAQDSALQPGHAAVDAGPSDGVMDATMAYFESHEVDRAALHTIERAFATLRALREPKTEEATCSD